jgi:signal transduction histidine kinase
MRSRLRTALWGFVLVILIPFSAFVGYGLWSLEKRRDDITLQVQDSLKTVDQHLRLTLERSWKRFIDEEQGRGFGDYFPVAYDPETAVRLKADLPLVIRSPLRSLGLMPKNDFSQTVTQAGVPDWFRVSLAGFFDFCVTSQSLVTPYDSWPPFPAVPGRQGWRSFLEEEVLPKVWHELGLPAHHADSFSVLLQLKASMAFRETFSQAQGALFQWLFSAKTPEGSFQFCTHYDYQFVNLSFSQQRFLVALRPVMLENKYLHLQGFVLNYLDLVQELQAYLEALQPEFGQVVVGFRSKGGDLFFEPMDLLSSRQTLFEEARIFRELRREEQRFHAILMLLLVLLLATVSFLIRLALTEHRLGQKKTDFISAITHELKAPLTSIQMYSEMLVEGWAKGKEETYYRHIGSESQRLSRLIHNVLDYARLERGQFVLKSQTVLLSQFFQDTLGDWRDWLEDAGVSLTQRIQPELRIRGDEDALKQVLYNMLDNAIKYGRKEDKVKCVLEAKQVEARVVVLFYDYGPGIPPRDHKRIFERFFRLERELTRESTGTGLGLALVREMVTGMGGKIRPFNHPNSGGFALELSWDAEEES